MRSFSCRLVPLVILLAGCGAKPQGGASDLNWAHYKPDSAYGGPLGRLEVLKQGFDVDFQKLKICVETGKKGLADDQLLLESRLAYAAWLDGAGGYGEDDWQKFEFIGAAKCHANDAGYAGFMVVVDQANADSGENQAAQFQPQHIRCHASGSQLSCQGNGITLGWGGPGSMTYYYFSSHGEAKWTKLSSYSPSSTTLSPYVAWLPMDKDIQRNTAAGLSAAAKQTLIDRYNGLLGKSGATLAELSAFVKDLAGAKLATSEDPVFSKLAQQFYNSGTGSLDQDYAGERGIFSTILHEIGHQYGMDHAHDPQHESITGASSGASQEANGQWKTDLASMAYGLPYLYLTADDQAGIKDDGTAVRTFLASHK